VLRVVLCILVVVDALSAVTVSVSVAVSVTVTVSVSVTVSVTVSVSSALFDVSLLIASPFYAFRAVTSASASSAAAAALAALAALRFLGDSLEGVSVKPNGRVKRVGECLSVM
jgi:hypothetical protein